MNRLGRSINFGIKGVVMMVVTGATLAGGMPLPPGWRLPTGAELTDIWRAKDPDKYSVVRGDFDGDGTVDQAMLLVSLRGRGLGLFVFLAQDNDTPRTYEIDVIKDSSFLRAMGIAKVSPGKYKTACGKGYWECKTGELPEIAIRHDSINYFKTESASSYIYWSERTKTFKRAWITD